MTNDRTLAGLLDSSDPALYDIQTVGDGPQGSLPLTDEMLRTWSSGQLFGLTQNAGMGWKPEDMLGPQYLLLSTQGRSEERRVGKEGRSRWSPHPLYTNKLSAVS